MLLPGIFEIFYSSEEDKDDPKMNLVPPHFSLTGNQEDYATLAYVVFLNLQM
jgi:hypothetical protein